ncbi:MAG: HAD-IIIC family phosphatase [Kiritimatiellae bacterium]|nr:HAD-IIIC family phosphatase [Kiritimatiellia bacterium]
MKIAASFWEEHCTECAMPKCYDECPMFECAWHGRCKRLESFVETSTGQCKVAFRRWGKMELVWRSRGISKNLSKLATFINRILTPLWSFIGFKHRAIRWRLFSYLGSKASFHSWQIRLKSRNDEQLRVKITSPGGKELFFAPMNLKANTEMRFSFSPACVPDGALFSIFSANGEPTSEINFYENIVYADKPKLIKCLVWDLDGTMWEGILSEDGSDKCKLKNKSLSFLKELDSLGVVNSIASKNDYATTIEVLKAFDIEQYFVFPEISWESKSKSIKRISSNLNIPFDQIAFIDDRLEQRKEVELNAPGVRTFSENEISLIRSLLPAKASAEGSQRRISYRNEMHRKKVLEQDFAGDLGAFIEESHLEVNLLEYSCQYRDRAFELLNRTNLLNISSRRYSLDSFDELISKSKPFIVTAKDKYGDYGTVGFISLNANTIQEMCFSCRVAGKGVEQRVLDLIFADYKIARASIVETDRNKFLIELIRKYLENSSRSIK